MVFVMATTQPEDLAETIRSRSQHFHFRALSFEEIAEALAGIAAKEGLDVEAGRAGRDGARCRRQPARRDVSAGAGARVLRHQDHRSAGARTAGRGARRRCSTSWSARSRRGRPSARLHWCTACWPRGKTCSSFAARPSAHFRNLLMVRVCGADSELVAAPAEERPRLARAAAAFSEEDLTRFFQILLNTEDDLRRKPDPRLHLEMGLLRMVNAARLAPLEEMLAELSGAGAASAHVCGSNR